MIVDMALWWRKILAVFGIYFKESMAYRASGVIWILTDVTTAITMPMVWISAAKSGLIAGFNAGETVVYYLAMLLVGSFVTSHIMWEIAMEIKDGQFSTQIIRPMNWYQITFLRNLTWRIVRLSLFAPFFLLFLWVYRAHLTDVRLVLGPEFWVSFVLGHLVSFTFVTMMALLALFVQEAMAIFELYYLPMLFLSGQLFPVAFLPQWAQKIAMFFPFYYTTGLPTEILIGRTAGSAAWGLIAVQLAWVVGCFLGARILWKHGLRQYTAVGM